MEPRPVEEQISSITLSRVGGAPILDGFGA
jgi:hypothetical protein